MIRLLRKLGGLLLCAMGFHDQHSWAQDHGYVPPRSHPCYPRPGDPAAELSWKFQQWTTLRCRRCKWRYPE